MRPSAAAAAAASLARRRAGPALALPGPQPQPVRCLPTAHPLCLRPHSFVVLVTGTVVYGKGDDQEVAQQIEAGGEYEAVPGDAAAAAGSPRAAPGELERAGTFGAVCELALPVWG